MQAPKSGGWRAIEFSGATIDARAYFRDVLTRISHESDVTKLTPHGWKQHFEAEVKARRDEILHRILGG